MKFLIPTLAILMSAESFAYSTNQSCLVKLKEFERKYVGGDVDMILLNQEDYPFSSGEYDPKTGAIALPYYQKGKLGFVLYKNEESYFVNVPKKQIKVNKSSPVSFKSKEGFCGEFNEVFGMWEQGVSPTRYKFEEKIASVLSKNLIGYQFKFKKSSTCAGLKPIPAYGLISYEADKLMDNAIEKDIEFKTDFAMQSDLTKDGTKTMVVSVECQKKGNYETCEIPMKQKYLELDGVLDYCIQKTENAKLKKTIVEKKNLMRSKAISAGLIEAEGQKLPTNSGAASSKQE